MLPDRCKLFIAAIDDNEKKEKHINWWETAHFFNMSSIGNVAIKEAVVALVEPDQIVTSAYMVKDLDLCTVKKEDLEFEVPFHLVGVEKKCIDALVTYFTVHFTKCHTPVGFSTCPNAPKTAYRQTKFYLKDKYQINIKDDIFGTYKCSKYAKFKINFHMESGSEKNEYSILHF
jgi:type I protein arginine methyltransferase